MVSLGQRYLRWRATYRIVELAENRSSTTDKQDRPQHVESVETNAPTVAVWCYIAAVVLGGRHVKDNYSKEAAGRSLVSRALGAEIIGFYATPVELMTTSTIQLYCSHPKTTYNLARTFIYTLFKLIK